MDAPLTKYAIAEVIAARIGHRLKSRGIEDMHETILEQQARIQELEDALRPFSNGGKRSVSDQDGAMIDTGNTRQDVETAARVLSRDIGLRGRKAVDWESIADQLATVIRSHGEAADKGHCDWWDDDRDQVPLDLYETAKAEL